MGEITIPDHTYYRSQVYYRAVIIKQYGTGKKYICRPVEQNFKKKQTLVHITTAI